MMDAYEEHTERAWQRCAEDSDYVHGLERALDFRCEICDETRPAYVCTCGTKLCVDCMRTPEHRQVHRELDR